MRKPNDDPSNRSLFEAKALMRRLGIRVQKGLGQNFLIDEGVLRTTIEAAEISPSDVVVEVGPGLGVLTQELIRLARHVVAVEIDTRLASALSQRFSREGNIDIINIDVLEFDPAEYLQPAAQDQTSDYKVIANLPYYIANPTIRHFLESANKPRSMVIMVQKEVAENISAAPGKMSILSVAVQLYGKAQVVTYVPPQCFYPSPAVESAIVRIDVYKEPEITVDNDWFFRVVKAGFSAPRKQLRNSLANGLRIPPAAALGLLERANITPQRRAETLSMEEWATLHWAVKESDSCSVHKDEK